MPAADGDRAKHFPAIEKKHGGPIERWIREVQELESTKYQDQIDHLRENHGFSQAHANALVMYVRGSTTSKRFSTADDFYRTLSPEAAAKAKEIFAAITKKYPKLELVTAWNQPMLRNEKGYVFGVSATKTYLLIAPFDTRLEDLPAGLLDGYKANKKTIQVPFDWKVNAAFLQKLVKARLDAMG